MNAENEEVLITRIIVTGKNRNKRKLRRERTRKLASERGLIDKPTVGRILGLSTRQIERLIVLRQFPPPLKFDRYVRWREDEILAWNAAGRPETNLGQYFKNKAGEPLCEI